VSFEKPSRFLVITSGMPRDRRFFSSNGPYGQQAHWFQLPTQASQRQSAGRDLKWMNSPVHQGLTGKGLPLCPNRHLLHIHSMTPLCQGSQTMVPRLCLICHEPALTGSIVRNQGLLGVIYLIWVPLATEQPLVPGFKKRN
jgi:hypothetical protein